MLWRDAGSGTDTDQAFAGKCRRRIVNIRFEISKLPVIRGTCFRLIDIVCGIKTSQLRQGEFRLRIAQKDLAEKQLGEEEIGQFY